MYTVIQVVHALLYIVAKCHFFSVVTWKVIIKYLQKFEGCTHLCEIIYMYIYIYIYIHSLSTLLDIPVQLHGNTNCKSANHMAATQCSWASRCGEDDLLKFKPSIRMGKKGDLSDFECGMVVGARRAGLSISKTADLLGFSHTISRVYREWSVKEKIYSER